MKNIKYLLVIMVVFVGGVVFAQSHFHSWTKVTQQDGVNNQKICQWSCPGGLGGAGGGQHYKTTSGAYNCPNP